MVDKAHLVEQTNLAFDYMQKLYLEVSYLIKEIEGILYEEEEKFIIGRPSGYGISARSSTGLESNNVGLWLLREFAVFFIPENKKKITGGVTQTKIDKKLRVLYVRIVLNNKNVLSPTIHSGVLHDIETKPSGERFIKKFERIMTHLEYNKDKVFNDGKKIDYEDAYIKIKGELINNKLFDINDSDTIMKKIINPSLVLYRK